MVHVGPVRMAMGSALVAVAVLVPAVHGRGLPMGVVVMAVIVAVPVRVLRWLVLVSVLMVLAAKKPYGDSHQRSSQAVRPRQSLAQSPPGQPQPEERCRGEYQLRARGSELLRAGDVQHQ